MIDNTRIRRIKSIIVIQVGIQVFRLRAEGSAGCSDEGGRLK
jgi:hypothetical protein